MYGAQVLLEDFSGSDLVCELLQPSPDPKVLKILLSEKCRIRPYNAIWRVLTHTRWDELSQMVKMLREEITAYKARKSGPIGLSQNDLSQLLMIERRFVKDPNRHELGDGLSAMLEDERKKREALLNRIKGKSLDEFKAMLFSLKTAEPKDRDNAQELLYWVCADLQIECPYRLAPSERRSWKFFREAEQFYGDRKSYEWVVAARREILRHENRKKLEALLSSQ